MFAYEYIAPSMNFGAERRAALKVSPLPTANEYLAVINDNVIATNEMIEKFQVELTTAIALEKNMKIAREQLALERANSEKMDDVDLLAEAAQEILLLKARIEKERQQVENYTTVISQINFSHSLISTAVSNMAVTIKNLFNENSEIFDMLVKINVDTGELYSKILETLDMVETVFLKRFEALASQESADLNSMMETVGAYYQLNTMVINKYAWNIQDVKDTMSVGRLDIGAYYDKERSDQLGTRDSFLDFVRFFSMSRGSNLKRFIDTKRPWKTTDAIGVNVVGFITGLLLGYKKNRKWR